MVFTREETNKQIRCQESKGSFHVGVFFSLSLFKWSEMFKAGLLLLEVM